MKKIVLSIALLLFGAGLQAIGERGYMSMNPEAQEELQKCRTDMTSQPSSVDALLESTGPALDLSIALRGPKYDQECIERVKEKYPGEVDDSIRGQVMDDKGSVLVY